MDFDALLEPHRHELELRLSARTWAQADTGSARLQVMAADQLRSGGKRLRGLLPVALVQAGQGPLAAAFELGACIEWVHNGTLVHDDIQDGDALRRGKPTLWTIHGAAQAINAGDAMLVGPLAALLRAEAIAADLRAPLAGLLAEALFVTIQGQVADLALRDLEAPTLADLRAVHVAKTGPLFAACLAGAAMLLRCPAEAIEAAHRLAMDLGLAFQVRDDLLDALGLKGRGAAGADLREGKPTWPMLRALDSADEEEKRNLYVLLQRSWHGPSATVDEIAEAIAMFHSRGGIAQARADLDDLLTRARQAAAQVFPAPSAAVVHALCDRLARLDG